MEHAEKVLKWKQMSNVEMRPWLTLAHKRWLEDKREVRPTSQLRTVYQRPPSLPFRPRKLRFGSAFYLRGLPTERRRRCTSSKSATRTTPSLVPQAKRELSGLNCGDSSGWNSISSLKRVA